MKIICDVSDFRTFKQKVFSPHQLAAGCMALYTLKVDDIKSLYNIFKYTGSGAAE